MLVLSLSLLACTREVMKETPLCDAPAAWYLDADGDGWGSDAPDQAPLEACFAPAGYAAGTGDCDDADPAVHPGQAEPDCGAQVDANCDGSVGPVDADGDGVDACSDCDDADSGTGSPSTWSLDADGDGYGGTRLATTSCEAPEGYVAGTEDCDDLDAAVNPDALEVCDGLDNDCSGDIDEGVEGGSAWYRDADGDGHGDPGDVIEACGAPGGYVPRGDDCDDRDVGVLPGAAETCDGIDQDCDGSVDEDAEGALPWYPDTDGDGVGATGAASWSCVAIEGHVAVDGDCDDTDAGAYPGATETCDGVDQDCDGDTDEDATDALTWYADLDGDGTAGSRWTVTQCDAPGGYLAAAGDCDDLDDTRYPGAPETCDGEDDDCDGLTDEDALDEAVWYADVDGDGAGDPSDTLTACDAPLG